MARVRLVFPTAWDRLQLRHGARRWAAGFDIEPVAPDDADCADDFDVLGFVDAAVADWSGAVDGVCSASDYPGAAVAAAIATGLGLPGSTPQAIMRAAHKGLAREVQRRCAPAATPPFVVIDPDHPGALADVPLPAFVKPVKGCYSVLARRVDDREQLLQALADPAVADYRGRYLRIYRQLVARYLGPDVDGTAFVAEGVLVGQLVTVEAWATADDCHAIGVVDSVVDPKTRSFVAFEYPSTLPAAVQRRLEALAVELGRAFGLRWTLYNVELTWDPATDRIGILEINPRMCAQFADLYEKVDGVHGHRLAFELACGREPRRERGGGAFAAAASFPLRVFDAVRVAHAPTAAELQAATATLGDAIVLDEVATGDVLRDFTGVDDGLSFRYAVLNVGGRDRSDLDAQRAAFLAAACHRFEPLS